MFVTAAVSGAPPAPSKSSFAFFIAYSRPRYHFPFLRKFLPQPIVRARCRTSTKAQVDERSLVKSSIDWAADAAKTLEDANSPVKVPPVVDCGPCTFFALSFAALTEKAPVASRYSTKSHPAKRAFQMGKTKIARPVHPQRYKP